MNVPWKPDIGEEARAVSHFPSLLSSTVYAITGPYYDLILPAVREVMFNKKIVNRNKLYSLTETPTLKLIRCYSEREKLKKKVSMEWRANQIAYLLDKWGSS